MENEEWEKLKKFKKKDIINLLKNIGQRIEEDTTVFVVGGSAMSIKGIKAVTRDIDLVIMTKRQYDNFYKTLIKMGYICDGETISEDFYKTPVIFFRKGDKKIDVFIRDVGDKILLTDHIQGRSALLGRFGKLIVKIASNEDIFLFKLVTDREKDLPDCATLIKEKLNWNKIKEELHRQETKELWRFWVYEQLCRIRNKFGTKLIPASFMNYMWELVKEKWGKRPEDFMEGIIDERYENGLREQEKLKKLRNN